MKPIKLFIAVILAVAFLPASFTVSQHLLKNTGNQDSMHSREYFCTLPYLFKFDYAKPPIKKDLMTEIKKLTKFEFCRTFVYNELKTRGLYHDLTKRLSLSIFYKCDGHVSVYSKVGVNQAIMGSFSFYSLNAGFSIAMK